MSEAEMQERTIVSDKAFVITWQQANNADEVADSLGLKRASVVQRACNLRKKGVPLKKYPRAAFGREARTPEYFADLAALAAEHGETSELPAAENDNEATPDEN